jgi:S-DNA-T family DNA segregation ATPase FtsK/SpoIIIE
LGGDDGRFTVEVDHQEDVPVPLLELLPLLPEAPPLTAVLGLAEDGRPVLLNLAEEDMTHILVAGGAGAGKTALLRTIALSLARHNRQSQLQMLVCHPDNDENGRQLLEPLNYLPHMLASVVKSAPEVGQLFNFLSDEMGYRQQQQVRTPTIVVLVDQIVQLLEMGEGPLHKSVARLLRRGADVGIHLVLTTSRPQDDKLARWLKADLPVRIVGQVADPETAQVASGAPHSQAEYLLGAGDFLAVGNGEMIRFQAAYIGEYDLHLLLDELHRKRPPALLAQMVNTRPALEREETPRAAQPFIYDGKTVDLDVSAAKTVYSPPRI